jgi:prevent-host-death family protein
MTNVGSYEAKTHLPELLARVAKGERVTITRHGKPVAMLVPPPVEKKAVRRVIEEFKAYTKQQGRTLGGLTYRDLIEEGRRF